ncbi:MAG: hypothetical protein K9L85_00035 [Candidatus Peribacteraceae bacterium]|nr:hypothetical protein [Candidatus Peribacteraceae bacterium]
MSVDIINAGPKEVIAALKNQPGTEVHEERPSLLARLRERVRYLILYVRVCGQPEAAAKLFTIQDNGEPITSEVLAGLLLSNQGRRGLDQILKRGLPPKIGSDENVPKLVTTTSDVDYPPEIDA